MNKRANSPLNMGESQKSGAVAQTSYDETGQGLLIDLSDEEVSASASQITSHIVSGEAQCSISRDSISQVSGRKNRPQAGQQRFIFSLGDDLRQARQARGVSLEDVSSALRIRTDYLSALECGALGNIPTGYASGFVRHYVAYLGEEAVGLSPAEAATTIREATAPQHLAAGMAAGRGNVGQRLLDSPHGLVYGLSFLAFVTIYAIWYMATDRGFSAVDLMDQPKTAIADIAEPDHSEAPAIAGLGAGDY